MLPPTKINVLKRSSNSRKEVQETNCSQHFIMDNVSLKALCFGCENNTYTCTVNVCLDCFQKLKDLNKTIVICEQSNEHRPTIDSIQDDFLEEATQKIHSAKEETTKFKILKI